MRRCPQSAIVRSGARSRRAYSIPSCSGTQLSLAPQRQRHGQVTRWRSSRGSETHERLAGRKRVGVLGRPGEKRLRHLGIEPGRIGDTPPAERERASGARGRDAPAVRGEELPRPGDADHGDGHLADAARRRDPRRRREDDARHRLRAQDGGADSDEAAERVADPGGRKSFLPLEHREDDLREGVEGGHAAERARAPVARQLGNEHAPLPGQLGRDQAPVGGRAAEPVDEDDRRAGAAREVADPRACVRRAPASRTRESPVWHPSP